MLPPVLSVSKEDWESPLLSILVTEVVKDEPGQAAVLDGDAVWWVVAFWCDTFQGGDFVCRERAVIGAMGTRILAAAIDRERRLAFPPADPCPEPFPHRSSSDRADRTEPAYPNRW